MPAVNHFNTLATAMKEEFARRPPNNSMSYMEHDGNRYWWVYDVNGGEVTKWECRPFPGCASLVVTTQIELRQDLRGRGLGTYFHELRRRAYKRAGFVGEVCTVRSDSEAQTAIVAHQGRSMGVFPSDFGGTYNVWLIPLNVVPAVDIRAVNGDRGTYVMTRETPAPTVDLCGNRRPYTNTDYCERPLGHPLEHRKGAATWPNFDTRAFTRPTIETTPPPTEFRVTLPENPTLPVRVPVKFSHRKSNVQGR